MAITLKDVASVAGVSTATVSRALAGSERVAPQTASHIRSIADDLGYRFDNVARALRQKRSNLVGLVLPDFAFPYGQELLFALNQELYQAEFVLAAVSSFGSVENEYVQVQRLLGQRIDALLIAPVDAERSAEAIHIAHEEEIPVFQLYQQVDGAAAFAIHLDYAAGLESALRCLRGRTIRSVGYYDNPAGFAAAAKRDAFQCVMAEAGLDDYGILGADGIAIPPSESDGAARCAKDSPDLMICASADIPLRLERSLGESPSVAEGTTIVCLDPLPAAGFPAMISCISVEYPHYGMARNLVDQISSALNSDGELLGHVSVQPFINLSRYRCPAAPSKRRIFDRDSARSG